MSNTTDATGPDFVELTLNHRCDVCSAAAVAQIEIREDLPHLLLCAHHHRKHLPYIRSSNFAYDAPDEVDYQFTGRELMDRPQRYLLRDAGSTV